MDRTNTDPGEAPQGGPPAPNGERPPGINPLRVQMREADEAKVLITRVWSANSSRRWNSPAHRPYTRRCVSTRSLTVIYFVPGDEDTPPSDARPTLDNYQHRGYAERCEAFGELGVKVISVSSQSMRALQQIGLYFVYSHLMLSDPDLEIARALQLPTTRDGDREFYRRLTLVTDRDKVQKVFPVAHSDATEDARRVLAWLNAYRSGW